MNRRSRRTSRGRTSRGWIGGPTRSDGGVGAAAVGPRQLAELGGAEVDGAHVAAPVAIVVGLEQLAARLDLIEREPELLLGAHARLAVDAERGELGGDRLS